ncbi:hypothetical protein QQS21_012689 [Conoideocrella luteorostrata]|uniref:Uncharacterized protein n=1 Tax=Conoideocrella luteorostrata TaxID=1105319 RepID=A0AAJ0FSG9_9HYPO|nr:hypothetical protein QQS21_012689 [Conoideocrella luteorostrata]
MYAGTILGVALALCSTTTVAVPAVNGIHARDGDNDNNLAEGPWVEVDADSNPSKTITPAVSTVSGTPSPVGTAPHDLTASVYTINDHGRLYTSTMHPPNPTATNANGAGSFSRCFNEKGQYAPFCRPTYNSSIYVGNTYYVTWDPDWFNKTEMFMKTRFVTLQINYFNETTHENFDHDKSNRWYDVRSGVLPLTIQKDYLRGRSSNNVTFQLVGHEIQNATTATNRTVELPVVITTTTLDPSPPTPVPKGRTLVIALPVVFGTLALLLIGGCIWNRKTRSIQLGNIMSRSRNGYTGRRSRNLFNRKDNGIQLNAAPVSPPPVDYRDIPDRRGRDGEALGSLTGSPVRAHFEEQDTTGGRHNAFRDEVRRQDRERRDL